MQSAMMQILYKGIFRWFLKLIVGVQFPDTRFLRKEGQFIILANHNSHLDTLSLLSSLPGNLLWKIKPVAAEDYFGRTRFQAAFSNYFINTLLIRRKGEKDSEHDPLRKMLDAIDEGYSLIFFPKVQEGSPNKWENKVRHSPYLVSATGTEIYTGFHDRHGTFTPQGRINLIALQGIHLLRNACRSRKHRRS